MAFNQFLTNTVTFFRHQMAMLGHYIWQQLGKTRYKCIFRWIMVIVFTQEVQHVLMSVSKRVCMQEWPRMCIHEHMHMCVCVCVGVCVCSYVCVLFNAHEWVSEWVSEANVHIIWLFTNLCKTSLRHLQRQWGWIKNKLHRTLRSNAEAVDDSSGCWIVLTDFTP